MVLEERGDDETELSQAATERAPGLSFSHRRLINKHTLTIDFQTAINRKRLPQPETNTTLEVHPVDQVNSGAIIDSLMTALRQCEQEIVFGDGRDLIGSSTERDAGSVFNLKTRDKTRKTLQFPCYQNHSLLRHAFSTGAQLTTGRRKSIWPSLEVHSRTGHEGP